MSTLLAIAAAWGLIALGLGVAIGRGVKIRDARETPRQTTTTTTEQEEAA